MNKGQYRAARRLIRDNGVYALRWMDDDTAPIMDVLCSQQADPLAERAAVVAYSARAGLYCDVRKTATLDLLGRFEALKRPRKGVKRLLVGFGRYAAYFPQERPIQGLIVRVWDESGAYMGIGVGVDTRESGGAISINGKRYDSNHILHWVRG